MIASWSFRRKSSDRLETEIDLNSLKLNTEYTLTHGAFWMIYGITGSFAAGFMLAKGYTNMHIGMTLAAANLLALALQPFVADHMDRAKGIKIIDAMVWMILLIMLTGAGYFFFGNGSFLLAAAIAAVLAIHSLIQPLLNSLAFRLSESGTDVNYAIGRAGGSLGYSIIVAVLGTLIEKKGEISVPVCMEAACALLIVMLFITRYSFKKMKRANDIEIAEHNGKAPEGCLISFKDGDRRNCNIDNLMCITKAEHAILNRHKLRSDSPELTETGLALAKLKHKIQEVQKEGKNGRKSDS